MKNKKLILIVIILSFSMNIFCQKNTSNQIDFIKNELFILKNKTINLSKKIDEIINVSMETNKNNKAIFRIEICKNVILMDLTSNNVNMKINDLKKDIEWIYNDTTLWKNDTINYKKLNYKSSIFDYHE